MCIVQYLTIIHYADWNNFISGSNGTSLTASAETDVKVFSWLKHKVVHYDNAQWLSGNSISERKHCCESNVVLWSWIGEVLARIVW